MKTYVKIIVAPALLALLATINSPLSTLHAQGTAFTYQGRLDAGVNPANGSYDLRFIVYDSSLGGSQQGPVLTNAGVSIVNGLFTSTLDFGNQFPGAGRWLEIAVRTNGNGAFTTLSPRQPLTPAPYAVYAGSANASNLVGTIPAGNLSGSGAALLAGGNALTGNQTVNSGSVGIGTASPAKPLDVTGTATGLATNASVDPSVFVRVNNTATDGGFSSPDVAGIGFGHDSTRQAIVGGTFGNDYLDFYTGGLLTAPKMRIDSGGNVGIGTTTPAALLDVKGSGLFQGAVGITGNNTLQFGAGVAGQEVSAGKIGYEVFTPDSLDVVGAGTNIPTRKIKFWAEGGANFNGSLGIGVTTPAAALDVAGDAHIAGKISSPMWRATTVINAVGPIPLTNSFTSGGGTLVIFASGSGYASSAGVRIGMTIVLDGAVIDSCHIWTDVNYGHLAFVPKTTVLSNVAAGTHTIELFPTGSYTTTDSADEFRVTVQELPF